MVKLGQVIILQSRSSVTDRVHLVLQIQPSHAEQASSIRANKGFRVGTPRVSSIRKRWDLTQLLACGVAGWALAAAAVGWHHCKCCLLQQQAWHQGMRQDTAGRKQEADTETAWKAGQPSFLSRAICFLPTQPGCYSCKSSNGISKIYLNLPRTTGNIRYRFYSTNSIAHLSSFSVWPTSLRWPGIKQLIYLLLPGEEPASL